MRNLPTSRPRCSGATQTSYTNPTGLGEENGVSSPRITYPRSRPAASSATNRSPPPPPPHASPRPPVPHRPPPDRRLVRPPRGPEAERVRVVTRHRDPPGLWRLPVWSFLLRLRYGPPVAPPRGGPA